MSEAQTETKPIPVMLDQLPASCPPREQAQWNMHPRVYLDFKKTNEAHCPYCGNHFILQQTS